MNNPIIFETRRRLNGTDFGYVACEVQHDLGTFRLGMMWQTLCRRGVPMGYQPRQPVYDRPDHGLGTGLRDPPRASSQAFLYRSDQQREQMLQPEPGVSRLPCLRYGVRHRGQPFPAIPLEL
jgi:hypothetical protein